jgi:glycosyltransferase involved in cell wall biosynthesis
MPLQNLDNAGVSVVMCCYNSAERIIRTLEHLSKQEDTNFSWEILLIDNNSSDNTAGIARNFWNSVGSEIPLIVIPEPRPGTMYARKAGIERAHYRYLLFCDDDNWLNEKYVKTAFHVISSSEEIAVVGGLGILEFEDKNNLPEWVDKFKYSYGAGPQGKADGDTTYGKGCLYTAGAAVDRLWLEKLFNYGFVSSLKGRDGKSLVAGEDTELTFALKLIGGKLYYSSEMHFKHFMPARRINWEYLKRLHESFGYSDLLISPYSDYFYKGKVLSVFELLINTARIYKNRLANAKKVAYAEGSIETLNVYRSRGAVKALTSRIGTYLYNRRMVKRLSKKNRSNEET